MISVCKETYDKQVSQATQMAPEISSNVIQISHTYNLETETSMLHS